MVEELTPSCMEFYMEEHVLQRSVKKNLKNTNFDREIHMKCSDFISSKIFDGMGGHNKHV